jgi:hypothetical protein
MSTGARVSHPAGTLARNDDFLVTGDIDALEMGERRPTPTYAVQRTATRADTPGRGPATDAKHDDQGAP